MALQDEQQIRTASSDSYSLVTANIYSDRRLPRSSLQPTALDAAALREKDPTKQQEEFEIQVLKELKCGPTWSGLEGQGGQVGSPGGAQRSSTPTVSSHWHKALGSPCFSHLRRQRVSTMYHWSFILICLCLQMPILAAEPLQPQGRCIDVMNILDGKPDLFCKLQYPQNVKNIRETCSKYPDSKVVYLCEDRRETPEKALREFAGLPVIGEPETCYGMRNLTFHNNSWHCNCISKNGSSSSIEPEEKVSESIVVPVIVVLALSVLLLTICVNWCKNRSSKSQPSPSHLSSQAIQPPYVPACDTDPEDDDLHSVATDGSADTATATADTHDAVPGETSINPTEDPYPSGTTTMDTFLTADSESVNAYDSAYCESYDSASLDAEACGSAVAAFPGAEDKNDLLSKYDSQKQVEMLVFAVNQQVYNPEYR